MRPFAEDEEQSGHIRTVAFATAEMMHAHSVERLVAALEQACRSLLPIDRFRAFEYDAGTHAFIPMPDLASLMAPPGLDDPALLLQAVHERRPQTVSLDDAARYAAYVPVLLEEATVGVFAVGFTEPESVRTREIEILELLASIAGIALSNVRLQAERSLAEEAHRVSESRFRAMFEQFPLSVQIFDPEGRTLAVNRAWERLFGFTIDDVRGYNPLHDPQLEPVREYLERGFSGEIITIPPHPFDTAKESSNLNGRSDSQRKWLEVTVWPASDPDGQIKEVIVVHRDVSERITAEAALKTSEASYRAIFELAGDAMFVHDMETGAVLDANQKACELHGYTLEELREGGVALISDGNPPYDPAHAREWVHRAARGEPQLFEWRGRNRAGDRFWVEVSLHRIPLLGQDCVVASVRNVDERRRAVQALQEAHSELEQRVEERTTELERRTADLERAEHRFRAIVEGSPTPLLISRITDGTILYANDRVEALIGLPPGTVLGQKTLDYYCDPSDRPRILEILARDGYVRDHELRINTEFGPRWVSLSVERLDFDGVPSVATSMIDITERKETEEALRASEESFRGLFDNLVELVYIQDLDGRFLNVNEAVLRAYGYSREELIGKTPDILAAPGRVDLEDTQCRFARAVEGEPEVFQWWGLRKDGSVFPKEVVLKRSTYFGRDVVIAVARDITDRLEAEDALRRSEEHFRLLIENSSDVATIVDANGVTRYLSPSSERVTGYPAEERIGLSGFEFIHPDDLPIVRKALAAAVADPGSSHVAEYRFKHQNGSWRVMHSTGRTLMPDDASAGVIVNTRDITERVAAERTLRMQKSLLEAQGEASIDGILVVSPEGKILSYNRRFQEMWGISHGVLASRSDDAAIQAVLDQLSDPQEFISQVEHLYAHRYEEARDEIGLKDGRVLDRYSAPITSTDGDYYGRVWFFRDITLEKQHALEMEHELEIGRKIQQGFLPAKLPQPDGWEIAACFQPAWQVAGDFYDVFELAHGRLGLLVADVRGKGVGASLFMALFRSLLRAYAERAGNDAPPGSESDSTILLESINATNDYIARVHKKAHMFASVFFALVDPRTGSLTYVNAGHEPPVVTDLTGTMDRLGPSGPALGLLDENAFGAVHTQLGPEQTLFVYTDGVTEARSPSRAFFSEERLLSLLDGSAPSAADLLERIERALIEHAGGAEQSDDVTLLAVRRRG